MSDLACGESFQAFLTGAWESGVRESCVELADGPPFQTVAVRPADDTLTRRTVEGFVDWWPRDRIAPLQASFADRLIRSRESFPYAVCAGGAHTARILWELRWRADVLPAAWLAAFLLAVQTDRGVGPVWETPTSRRLLADVFDDCAHLLVRAGVPLWHHAHTGHLPGARAAAWQLRRLGVAPLSRESAVAAAHLCLRLVLAGSVPVRLQTAAGSGGALRVLDVRVRT